MLEVHQELGGEGGGFVETEADFRIGGALIGAILDPLEEPIYNNVFQSLSYTIDFYWGRVDKEKSFIRSSAEVYRRILGEVEAWLESRDLPYYIPSVLSSELYADLSHPFGRGYALLAESLWEQLSSS